MKPRERRETGQNDLSRHRSDDRRSPVPHPRRHRIKGHNAPEEHKFKVYTQGQKRGVTDAIKRQLKRRAAVEPLIGHTEEDHRMDRNFLAHREGDAINEVLAAAGCNFRRLLAWLAMILRLVMLASCTKPSRKKV